MAYKRPRAAFESDGQPQHAPFAIYGTPLPAYDPEARDDGSYVPVWKQEVTDERGRKRLHGAFTGGFSAGYFNTVGSKEGWAPSTFVSSRTNRAKDAKDGKQQRAEDYMDDEDLAEQAETQKLETQGAFAGLGDAHGGASAKGMFSDMFRPTGETKGAKLLQRMGWRQGQGIGPKVRRQAKGDAKGETHLFAPENSRMISFVRKNDRKGVGFGGEARLESTTGAVENEDDDSGEDARILRINRSKHVINAKTTKKSGFGTGVLNDGSDDEDPYTVGPSISYNRVIGGKKKKAGIFSSNATSSSVVKPSTLGARKTANSRTMTPGNGTRKCHDGRLPIDGFVLAMSSLDLADAGSKYPPPTVPAGWVSSRTNTQANTADSQHVSTADAAKASVMDSKARATLLGEEALPGKSVFDYLTPAARERLANASGRSNLPPALGEKAPEGYKTSENDKRRTLWDFVPKLSKETAAMALQRGRTGWMPYAEDEDKRARYKYFLELSSGLQSNLPERPKTMEAEAWAQEMREFVEAAEIFKPVTGMMASRFTSSTSAPKLASDAPDSSEPAGGAGKEEDAAEKAARMGMYGPLTRSKVPFFPTRLLCKRFNVRPPATVSGENESEGGKGGGGLVDAGKRLDIVSQASLDRIMLDANYNAVRPRAPAHDGELAETEAALQQPAAVDVEKNEALEGQKAGEDVFKAIFGSDDEDDG
ncbi:related to growth regulation protein WHI2 [Ramularia collo-cygni]|uniref:Related to growth regulation protein WHI2 n=1 Tax=Ramularia collo-cygni TaxID=112498 RepID=A0A2D3VF55_9PEZI|nr:related to growth regulation protein WHI2 [Ramularia collo-cygni]CZT24495.1 related to growth regulation protein WHI2 [Ramularia collo-cygni]